MRFIAVLGCVTVALALTLAPAPGGAVAHPDDVLTVAAKKADPRLKTAKAVVGDLTSLSTDLSEAGTEASALSTMFTGNEYPCRPPDAGTVDGSMVWLATTERTAGDAAAAAAEHVRDAVPDLKAGRKAPANRDLRKARTEYTEVSDVQPMMLGSYQYMLTHQARLMECYGNQDGARRAQRLIELLTQIEMVMNEVKRQHIHNLLEVRVQDW